MKRWILVLSAVATALVFCASATQRAGAHVVPTAEAGAAFPDVFHATTVLTTPTKIMAAVPCVDPPVTPEPDGMAGPYPCRNVDLAAFIPSSVLAGGNNSDIWGWTDTLCTPNREYAIMGMSQGTVFIDVTIPEAPVIRGYVTFPPPTPGTLWREVKVYSHDPGTPANKADDTHHAYIVQDLLGSGVQIFDLTRLRLPPPADPCASPVGSPIFNVQADAAYTQQGASEVVENVHTITINQATGFAYLNGSNTCGGGAPHMIDLKPNAAFGPENPKYMGCAGNDGYTHDAQCVFPYHGPDTEHHGKEICVLYNEDTLTVVDVSNKSAPVLLERQGYDTARYTHQGWFTVDQKYIISDDELDEGQTAANMTPTKTYLWDATDLNNLVKINTFFHPNTRTADPNDRLICIDHNQYTLGNLVYQSNYACGLRIYNVRNIGSGTITEVANFDTMPATDISFNIGGDLTGDWSNYPYFKSGTVVVSNIATGFFVLQPRVSPTAVKLTSFRAQQAGKRVKLTWRTASESDILGFRVFRDSRGKRVEVTKSIVAARASTGARYSLVDRTAAAGAHTYKLQVVSKDGLRAFKATATIRVH